MSDKAERLQDAIGLIKDEYILEAHGEDTAQASEQADKQASGAEAQTDVQAGGAKVVEIPAQRKRRRATGPIAIAACLVIALGVGALAFTSLSAPSEKEAAVAEKEVAEYAEGDSAPLMATESATGDAGARLGAGAADSYNLVPGHPDYPTVEGEAFVLTAGEWNDNANWPFFMNLVNSNTVSFPSFGLDPTHRVKATVSDKNGNPVRGEQVALLDNAGNTLWTGVSDKDGAAYLFYGNGQEPYKVSAGGVEEFLAVTVSDSGGQQSEPSTELVEDVAITIGSDPKMTANLQVMFIVDTTGSMSDEIAYLQKDFASIAGDVGNDGVEYSVNFYRDEGDAYVTKCNGFTDNVSEVQALLNKEYADGGGDTPEAVAQILDEAITNNNDWDDKRNKLAFLIFDAPPHDGTDATIEAAVASAAERGIRLVPVVASNADRETELFGRALAIMTDGTYVFLTDDSGVGDTHLEPIIGDYSVELLHDTIVRIIQDNR